MSRSGERRTDDRPYAPGTDDADPEPPITARRITHRSEPAAREGPERRAARAEPLAAPEEPREAQAAERLRAGDFGFMGGAVSSAEVTALLP